MATPQKRSRVAENNSVKPRCSNFNKKEVERLEALIQKYKHILFSKKIDQATTKQKETVWNCIQEEFNANEEGHRTVRQLRNKFENIKKSLKREADLLKRRANKTRQSSEHDTSDWMDSTSNIDGNEGYDDDAFIPKRPEITQFVKCEISNENNENLEAEGECFGNMEENSCSSKSNEPFECNAPQSALEKTIVTTVKRIFKTKNKEMSVLQLKKLKVIEDLHNLELEKMRDSIKQQEELHNQIMKNNEEKHNLEIIKLNLEIEVLTLKKMELMKNTDVNF